MCEIDPSAGKPGSLTRRGFFQLGVAGLAGLGAARLPGPETSRSPELEEAIARLEFLTREEDFTSYGRGKPPPDKLPPEKRREVGLEPETWQLEVLPDPESEAKLERPMSKALRSALTWKGLMELAEGHAVRFMSVMSCTNGRRPCGMGLWEGVPLREVIWRTQPSNNVRRVFYDGYHNEDPEQRFQSSLAIARVLEDPPGEHPVLLCYKLNGHWLTSKRGGPVRMLVPDAYGNKSVKWLQRVYLTSHSQPNDTYALWKNDTESPIKTCARFIHVPTKVKTGQSIPITGLAQVGLSGLAKVQYWCQPKGEPLPQEDPYFTQAQWLDAEILPPPTRWGGGLPEDKLPPVPRQIDPVTGRPWQWPMRHALVHWAALLPGLASGQYTLRCRTIDASGAAQPMPRPFPKSGHNAIEKVTLQVGAV